MPWLLIPVTLVICYLLFRRLLITKRTKTIVVKSLRPVLWFFIASYFFYTVHVINLIVPAIFMACMIATSIVFGLFCFVETQTDRNFILDNALTMLFILLAISLSSLLLAFWHWPTILVLILIWIVSFLVALWWLLDFTNNPQILASLWAFVVIELCWLASRWIILYQIPKIPLIISQIACIIVALAYGWGGIYYHYKRQNLRRGIVFEYLIVTTVIFVVLLALNRWVSFS